MRRPPHSASRRAWLAAAWSLALPGVTHAAEPDWLVTPDEVARLRAGAGAPLWLPKVAANAPMIQVLQPAPAGDAPLASPLAIELAFRAAADAAIDVASFRIFYGTFSIDVTQRLLKSVAVKPEGLRVERAAIPAGSHRLVLQIADMLGRTSTRELRFSVR